MTRERLQLSPSLRSALPRGREFNHVMALDGEEFRHHKNRRTVRARIGEREYFIKVHRPTSWAEILKHAARLRWPVLSSTPEWNAIARLTDLGIATTPAEGRGVRGAWPHRLESFLVTRALDHMKHLSDLPSAIAGLPAAARARLKCAAIEELAVIARTMHEAGLNHRDFYLCHFMLPDRDWRSFKKSGSLQLHVIDLHRVQIRKAGGVPRRWIIKDIAGLLFSSLDAGITSIDCIRFMRGYWGHDWRARWNGALGRLWRRQVVRKAVSVYRSDHGREPRLPAGLANSA